MLIIIIIADSIFLSIATKILDDICGNDIVGRFSFEGQLDIVFDEQVCCITGYANLFKLYIIYCLVFV